MEAILQIRMRTGSWSRVRPMCQVSCLVYTCNDIQPHAGKPLMRNNFQVESVTRISCAGQPIRQNLRHTLVGLDMTVVFFFAFLALVWLLCLPAYWLFFSSPQERKGSLEKLEWYRKQPLWPHGVLKVMFVALNAWALFPVRGVLVSLCVIAVFLAL